MSIERTQQPEAHRTDELLKAQFYQLLESRGIDAEAVLVHQRRVTVTLDYFFDDESLTVTPEVLLNFIGAIYPERTVGIKEIHVSLYRANANEPVTSSIGLTVSNKQPWMVEQNRTDEYRGIVIPSLQQVHSEYLLVFPSESPLRYALTAYHLEDWLRYHDGVPVHAVEGSLSPEVVASIASLLPDHDVYARRPTAPPDTLDPDLKLPPPAKLITIS